MGVSELPGSAAPSQDLGGIERLYRWEVPFSAEEIRTVRLSYAIGDSRTDRASRCCSSTSTRARCGTARPRR
jgi:hypothetical protein